MGRSEGGRVPEEEREGVRGGFRGKKKEPYANLKDRVCRTGKRMKKHEYIRKNQLLSEFVFYT